MSKRDSSLMTSPKRHGFVTHAPKGTVCSLPVRDVLGALKAITCLRGLTSQMKVGPVVDELGHTSD